MAASSVQSYSRKKGEKFCPFHPNKELFFLCKDCDDMLACNTCICSNHLGHQLVEIETIVQEKYNFLQDISASISNEHVPEILDNFNEAEKIAGAFMQHALLQRERATTHIEQMQQALLKVAREDETRMLNFKKEFEDAYMKYKAEFNPSTAALENIVKACSEATKSTNNILIMDTAQEYKNLQIHTACFQQPELAFTVGLEATSLERHMKEAFGTLQLGQVKGTQPVVITNPGKSDNDDNQTREETQRKVVDDVKQKDENVVENRNRKSVDLADGNRKKPLTKPKPPALTKTPDVSRIQSKDSTYTTRPKTATTAERKVSADVEKNRSKDATTRPKTATTDRKVNVDAERNSSKDEIIRLQTAAAARKAEIAKLVQIHGTKKPKTLAVAKSENKTTVLPHSPTTRKLLLQGVIKSTTALTFDPRSIVSKGDGSLCLGTLENWIDRDIKLVGVGNIIICENCRDLSIEHDDDIIYAISKDSGYVEKVNFSKKNDVGLEIPSNEDCFRPEDIPRPWCLAVAKSTLNYWYIGTFSKSEVLMYSYDGCSMTDAIPPLELKGGLCHISVCKLTGKVAATYTHGVKVTDAYLDAIFDFKVPKGDNQVWKSGVNVLCDAAFDAYGHLLVADYQQQAVYIADAENGKLLRTITSPKLGNIRCLAVHKNGDLVVATHNPDQLLRIKYLN